MVIISDEIMDKLEKSKKLIDQGKYEDASCLIMETTVAVLENAGETEIAKEIRERMKKVRACVRATISKKV
jgi:hypothetical protein